MEYIINYIYYMKLIFPIHLVREKKVCDSIFIVTFMQVVYNANKLAKLVKKKSKMQNWLVYYQNKLERTSKRPETKVFKF